MSCFMLQCAESFKASGYFKPEWALESQMLRDVEQKEGPGQHSTAIGHNFRLYLESNIVWKCVRCEVPTEVMTLSQDHGSWDTCQCASAQSCTIASWYVLVRECAHWKTHLASFGLASQVKVDRRCGLFLALSYDNFELPQYVNVPWPTRVAQKMPPRSHALKPIVWHRPPFFVPEALFQKKPFFRAQLFQVPSIATTHLSRRFRNFKFLHVFTMQNVSKAK